MTHSRRSVLRRGAGLAVAGTAASLAGCTGNGGGSSEEFDSGYAAFFTLNDWANEVAGDNASFEDPVDVGQLGHGWTPDGTLAADVAATDAFVYLDSPEFAWAQDLAATLESDYDTVATVDVLDGLEGDLLEWNHSHGESHDEEGHDEEGHDEGDHDGEGHDEGDHDNGTRYDPHVWTDPVLAAEMVDTIATGLGEADPDNAEAYAANAEAYAADLDAIDDAFRSIAEDAARDVAVLAGHNSFQYLEARYGFRLRSPVGVSPQNEPTQSEIADTIDLVDAEGIDVVLYDRFQSPRLAESIVENSGATEAVPVTPAGGTTREWNDAGYGYLEQMTEINVPAFERAFGAQ
ncbi:zinc transport system substrate-binding protein [Halorubrum ezzemoulense]|uniref:Zinc transport system substrate-binding protein n=1 Tax=Halorubrum ezzemoulense TaxID=337243 RepID=A0A238UW71_HALEZ|nr:MULTISPECIES: zinc ABC transporter substrate-binding protein [Halorubrum]MDB2263041.1 zinc ABC transporter substrate-binding protein [Halorubrum ezzemoulense]TKX41739.1 zinc ABC transporter substrate-binding protein [Halorubrum sp. CGM4_25_10-8A]TKX47657.1 zinc ABC transporter substrate-binding protein [Halorubrum sp. SD690R]SNR26462.1 zinc transport system substrate-binding protein [Halorubrum ezzemoulense]